MNRSSAAQLFQTNTMIRTTNLAGILLIVIFISLGATARYVDKSQITKRTGQDLGVIGPNQIVVGNGTIYPNIQVHMQITFTQDCYSRLTLTWDIETSLRSDLDFSIANSNNETVMLAFSQRIPEVTEFIMDSTRDDFGNGTFYLQIRAYEMFVSSIPVGFVVETSSTPFCSIADDEYENNQAPLDSPSINSGKAYELSMCNDDWFKLDIPKSVEKIYVTMQTNATGADPDFWVLDANFVTIFESPTQGNEEHMAVALTDSSNFYIMFLEVNSSRIQNYTYQVFIEADGSEKSANKVPLIAGLTVGLGVLAIGSVVAGVILFRRHRANKYSETVHEFVGESRSQGLSANYDQLSLQKTQSDSDTNYASIVRKSQVDRVEAQHKGSSLMSKKSRDNYEIDYSELTIIKEIGKGSFGVVYQAQWRQTTVAVKQLKISQMFENVEKGLLDFRREAELLKSLRPHPNVVLFLGITTEPLSIVIEFCDGGSLVTLLRDTSKTISLDIQIRILLGIARGMLHLHRENIIHRDLAARNILLGQDYIAKVSDFGLSRERRSSMMDKTESTIGPLKWMSVEAIQNQVFSTKSDVWSFGVVIWEVLNRTEPYLGMDAVNAAMKVCYEGLRLPIPKDCHPGFASVMKACWQLEPSARPSFEEICADLGKLEPKKTLVNPSKPIFLAESNSDGSLLSVNESNVSMETTYTTARGSTKQPPL